ncbi:MAG: hypothetical protein JNK11_21270 [Alphaproteobacteria bacterium]|nr:hypothetical protein [Alphaproteobacteria bacterium]
MPALAVARISILTRCVALLLVAVALGGCGFNPLNWFAGLFSGDSGKTAVAAAPSGSTRAAAKPLDDRSCYRDGQLLLLEDADCSRIGGMMVDLQAGPAQAPRPPAVPVPPVQSAALGAGAPIALAPTAPPAQPAAEPLAQPPALAAAPAPGSDADAATPRGLPPVPSIAAAIRGQQPVAALPGRGRPDPLRWGLSQMSAGSAALPQPAGIMPDGARFGVSEGSGRTNVVLPPPAAPAAPSPAVAAVAPEPQRATVASQPGGQQVVVIPGPAPLGAQTRTAVPAAAERPQPSVAVAERPPVARPTQRRAREAASVPVIRGLRPGDFQNLGEPGEGGMFRSLAPID